MLVKAQESQTGSYTNLGGYLAVNSGLTGIAKLSDPYVICCKKSEFSSAGFARMRSAHFFSMPSPCEPLGVYSYSVKPRPV